MPTGVVYFDDEAAGLTRMGLDGVRLGRVALGPTAAGSVMDLATGPAGDAWWGTLFSQTSPILGRLAAGASTAEERADTGAQGGSFGVTVAADGSVVGGGATSGVLHVFSPAGLLVRDVPVTRPDGTAFTPDNGAVSGPTGVALGPDGNVWFNHLGGQLGRLTPGGQVTSYARPGGPRAGLAITAGPDGSMWYSVQRDDGGATAVPGRIGRVTMAGTVTEWALPGDRDIVRLAAAADGAIWATDDTDSSLLRIDTGMPAAVRTAPAVTTGADGALSCGGEAFASWPGVAAPVQSVSWLRDGGAIDGATNRTYAPGPFDAGRAIACRVTARYAVPRVWAPATSAAVTLPGTPVSTPSPAPTPTRTPSSGPAATPTPTPAPGPTPAPTRAPAPTTTTPAPKPPFSAPIVKPAAQIVSCKFTRKGRKVSSIRCTTTLSAVPVAKSSRAVTAKLTRSGKAYRVSVIVGSKALRIVSPTVIPTANYRLRIGKLAWLLPVG